MFYLKQYLNATNLQLFEKLYSQPFFEAATIIYDLRNFSDEGAVYVYLTAASKISFNTPARRTPPLSSLSLSSFACS